MSHRTEVTDYYSCDICGMETQFKARLFSIYWQLPSTFSTGHPMSFNQFDICDACEETKSLATMIEIITDKMEDQMPKGMDLSNIITDFSV